MTLINPKITRGHIFLDDCSSLTGWVEDNHGLSSQSLTVLSKDYFDIIGTLDNAADEYDYWEKNITDFTGSAYPRFVIRWKTSAAGNALGAKASVIYDDATEEYILGTSTVPVFSTNWVVTTGLLTANKTVSKIRLYADDYPDSTASGISHVYFDFVMFCAGFFEFPYVSTKIKTDWDNAYTDHDIFNRVASQTEFNKTESGIISLTGEMDDNALWGNPAGQYLMDIYANAYKEPFQWFECNQHKQKVTMRHLDIAEDSDSQVRSFTVLLKEYRRSSGSNALESGLQRYGI